MELPKGLVLVKTDVLKIHKYEVHQSLRTPVRKISVMRIYETT